MDFTETPVRRVNGYSGIIVDVEVEQVKLSNGKLTMREVVKHPGGVCIVAVDDEKNVTMVRQFRYPFKEHLLEIPAGKLEPGEATDPLAAAKRELSEETGLQADKWQDLGCMYSSPGFSSERLYMYLATGLHEGAAHPDENELLNTEKHTMQSLVEQCLSGEIRDAKTQIGILKANEILKD